MFDLRPAFVRPGEVGAPLVQIEAQDGPGVLIFSPYFLQAYEHPSIERLKMRKLTDGCPTLLRDVPEVWCIDRPLWHFAEET